MKAQTKFIILIFTSSLYLPPLMSQDKYYPKGDPKKLQVEVTVPVWLPWISGSIGVDGLIKDVEGDINATPADLINHLKAVLMLNADISKGHFVGFVNYMHLALESDKKVVQPPGPQQKSYTWSVKAQTNVLDIAAGGRIYFQKGMLDPFFGVRYFNLKNELTLTDSSSTKNKSSTIEYWDPFFGARLFYYPKERLLLFLRADMGGIWGGNAGFSWNTEARIGYAISPTIDISGGFRAWSFKYSKYSVVTNTGNSRIFYMNPNFYGFEVAASFFIPKRNGFASKK